MNTILQPYMIRTAIKKHYCSWCGQAIESNKNYLHCVGIFFNDFSDVKMHFECYSAMERELFFSGYDDYYFDFYAHQRGFTFDEEEKECLQ